MSFYMSPGVYWKEIDMSATIGAVATSVAVIVLRNTYKGLEYEQSLVTNPDQLLSKFGEPTNKSYKDLLSALGFLKYGRNLYCTRVMPEDATFAGTKASSGYVETWNNYSEYYTFDKTGSVPSEEDDGPYDYTSLGTKDILMFPEQVSTSMDASEPLRFISKYRGGVGNNIRLLFLDKNLYESIKYFNEDTSNVDLPSGVTVTSEASGAAVEMYNNYNSGASNAYLLASDLSTPLESHYQGVVVVQAKDQGESNWETKEIHVVSFDESEKDDTGSSLFVESVINENSDYIVVAANPTYISNSEEDNGPIEFGSYDFIEFNGGKNGVFGRHDDTNSQEAEDAAVIESYRLYSNPEEIDVNLFIESDKGVEVKRDLISLCQDERKDCMAILDIPSDKVINNKGSEALDVVKWRKGQDGSTFNPNTSYASIYGNWLEVFDKWSKKYRWIPSSGYVAGLYAHTDNVADAWWAPAGLNRAILTGVRRLSWNPTHGERDILCKNGVNPIVSFSGQGKVIWGDWTLLDKTSAFNAVNVRRLFLVLEKSISKSSKYFLFEQNDEVTWMLMTNMIEPFLRDIKGRRGIYDFLVQIDENTNTPERIDRGELWGNIFIKPTRSVRFIRLNFIATRTGADFEELAEAINP